MARAQGPHGHTGKMPKKRMAIWLHGHRATQSDVREADRHIASWPHGHAVRGAQTRIGTGAIFLGHTQMPGRAVDSVWTCLMAAALKGDINMES